MLAQILIAVTSASLASAATLAVGYYLFKRRWLPRLESELKARWLPRLDEDLRRREQHLDEKLSAYGERLQEHVRQGIVDGVGAVSSGEALRQSGTSMAKTGLEVVSSGLESLLGALSGDSGKKKDSGKKSV